MSKNKLYQEKSFTKILFGKRHQINRLFRGRVRVGRLCLQPNNPSRGSAERSRRCIRIYKKRRGRTDHSSTVSYHYETGRIEVDQRSHDRQSQRQRRHNRFTRNCRGSDDPETRKRRVVGTPGTPRRTRIPEDSGARSSDSVRRNGKCREESVSRVDES